MADAKKTRTLSEIFSRYSPVSRAQRDLFASATDVTVRADRERRMVEVNMSLPEIVGKTVLYETEHALMEIYAQNSVRMFPHYPAQLFSLSYMDEIIKEARRTGTVINGFFDRYEASMDDGVITLSIPFPDGGIELLDLARTAQLLSAIIRSEFSLEYEVKIVTAENTAAVYQEYEAARDAWLRQEASRIPERAAAQAAAHAAQTAAAASEPDKPNLRRVASLFETEHQAVDLGDGVLRCGRTKFDVSAPELLAGMAFAIDRESLTPLSEITASSHTVTVLGVVFGNTTKELKNGEKIAVTIGITDRDASAFIKTVIPAELQDELFGIFKTGAALAIRGNVKTDKFDGELYIAYADVLKVKEVKRQDNAEQKRVELHLHTCQSAMDATTKPEEVVETAHRWGHRAVAITDHGNLQAYPTAMLKAEKLGMKVIYGVEAYFVDDTARAVFGGKGAEFDDEVVVFDIETTGLSAQTCKITEIGAVRVKKGEVLEVYSTLVNPGVPIPEDVVRLTGITDEMVADARPISEVLPEFFAFIGDRMLIAHNAAFDVGFIRAAAEELGLPFGNSYLDTVAVSRYVNPELKKHKLNVLAEYFNLGDFNHHRASDDAEILARIYYCMIRKLADEGIHMMAELNTAMSEKSDPLKLKTYHQVILVKNQVGQKNLYILFTDSYLKYSSNLPRIPRTRLEEMREGLIIGSACEAGELFTAVLEGKSQAELEEIASFYDYLEIQPICNNRFLVEEGKVADDEGLRDLNRKIIALGKKLGKPVVATCDTHYLDPEDEIYRRILLSGMHFSDADKITQLYFRTTEEML
ncbi:MAG: PHP domain-containing protein, partial [Clostridia bacterium]|nr:PHP domain-containing protein [Clostridia bacterium]